MNYFLIAVGLPAFILFVVTTWLAAIELTLLSVARVLEKKND